MKTAVITGSKSGIGRAIVQRLDENGWKVIELTRKDMNLADLKAVELRSNKLAAKIDRFDALIHVAGIWHDNKSSFSNRDLEDYSAGQIIDSMNVGVTSFMVLAAALLPKLKKNGSVVGISGTFADGASGWLPYYTSKRALEDFLVGLSQDYPNGPKVFGISPSDTATPAFAKFYAEYIAEAQPPETIADLLLQIVNDASRYISGEIIEVRDGETMKKFHA